MRAATATMKTRYTGNVKSPSRREPLSAGGAGIVYGSPPQTSRATSWKISAKPIVISTWPSVCPGRRWRKNRCIAMPMIASATAPPMSASA